MSIFSISKGIILLLFVLILLLGFMLLFDFLLKLIPQNNIIGKILAWDNSIITSGLSIVFGMLLFCMMTSLFFK